MTDIDLDLSGVPELQAKTQELKEDYEDEAVYAVGTNVEYSIYLEMGTRNMPPYPFFMPAVREFQANPESFILGRTEYGSIDEIDSTQEMVKAVASALQSQIQINATAQASGRSPGTAPDNPQVDTGNLRASISVQRVK